MNQDRFWELVSLKLSGEASQAEIIELEELLKQQTYDGLKWETLNAIWSSKPSSNVSKKDAFNRHMQRLSNHLSEPVLQYEMAEDFTEQDVVESKPIRKIRKWAWAGGIAASLLAATLILIFNTDNTSSIKPNAQNTVSTKRGSKSKVELPDGTQVWLNADSRITYNENFQGNQREVVLTGEAYFDVVRDESRPFIIHTPTIDVKVLGTSFNVRSYADEKNTETSLIHGSIEVTLVKSADKRKIILKPNDKLIVNNGDGVPAVKGNTTTHEPVLKLSRINYKKTDSSAIETLWVKNKLAFDEEPFEEIALKIERWYDVKVSILDENLKKEPYTATFERETLSEVLEALNAGGDFTYEILKSNKEVVIRK